MIYLAWAVLYEGNTDAAYFDVLIPRLMEELVAAGTQLATVPTLPALRLRRAGPDEVAEEACASREAFELVFIHADSGGRGLARDVGRRSTAYCEAMRHLCNWPIDRCVVVAPDRETEAWVLADPAAVAGALGYRGSPDSIGLPANAMEAERVGDPKATLQQVIALVRGRRRPAEPARVFPAVAQRQDFAELRRSASFQRFEVSLRTALGNLGCL